MCHVVSLEVLLEPFVFGLSWLLVLRQYSLLFLDSHWLIIWCCRSASTPSDNRCPSMSISFRL